MLAQCEDDEAGLAVGGQAQHSVFWRRFGMSWLNGARRITERTRRRAVRVNRTAMQEMWCRVVSVVGFLLSSS